MERKKIPLGESSFKELRERNEYYVDKTHLLYQLLEEPWPPKFLSRPRRFGKSLFLDTIQCLYEGEKGLFEGLYIYDKWDWHTRPVIKLDFSQGGATIYTHFKTNAVKQFNSNAERLGCKTELAGESVGNKLSKLIEAIYKTKKETKVVLLIDEYDSPLISMKDSPEEYALTHTAMKGLLQAIKDSRDYIEFVFMTGILKLSQHDFFAATNIFDDISLNPEYDEICGYTEKDLLHTFQPELEREDLNPDINIDSLREWYDGYSWGTSTRLYNPNDILFTFDNNKIGHWWTMYGLAPMAIREIERRENFAFDNHKVNVKTAYLDEGFSLTSKEIKLHTLLFQTGYLTLRPSTPNEDSLYLEPPNLEVRTVLAQLRFLLLTQEKIHRDEFAFLLDELIQCEFEQVKQRICQILAAIVYDEKLEELCKQNLSILIHSMFTACAFPGFSVNSKSLIIHSRGRGAASNEELRKFPSGAAFSAVTEGIFDNDEVGVDASAAREADLVLYYRPTNTYYVVELKVLGVGGNQPGCAMSQLKTRNYAAAYLDKGRVFNLGFEFVVSGEDGKPGTPKVTLKYLDWEKC